MKTPPTEKEKRIEEIKKILKQAIPEYNKSKNLEKVESREFKRFKEEELGEKKSLYEKLCKFSEFLNIQPDKDMAKKMQKAIDFAHLKITPKGAFSFAILTAIIILILTILSGLMGASLTMVLILFALSIASIFILTKYPEFLADNFRIKASEEIILAIIYMVIYMRTSPQLEGAVRFAAKNLSGPLAYDFRKILWDVETRNYETIYDAMTEYLKRWETNKEFIEAIQLINTSLEQPENKRHQMLDEAVNIILKGTEEKMKHYSQSLRTPIMVIFALGITLPILVLVLFPILMLLLSETVEPIFLVIGYDVILPLIIFIISYEILRRRPIGYSTVDTSLHPKYSPIGKLKIKLFGKQKYISLWPIGLIVSLPIIILGIGIMMTDQSPTSFLNLMGSLIITWGLGLGFATVFIIESKKKIGLRNQIKKIQDEFGEVLFQLGNRLALGNPLEKAMEQTMKKNPELGISELFKKTLKNIKVGNFALEAALFDKKCGAIWEYPSKLVINVMKIILEAAKKGVKNAALSAISISRYVKQVHNIEENLNDMLSETTSSMKLLGMFIAPLISGVTVTMTAIMMMIFSSLGATLETLKISGTGGVGGLGLDNIMIGGWGKMGAITSIGIFQLVVGIYMLEISYLLSFLISGIDNGPGDVIIRRELAGWTILIGLIIYTLSVLSTYSMFVPLISVILTI